MTGTPDPPRSVDLDRVLHDLDRLDVARLSDLGLDRIRVEDLALDTTSDLNDIGPARRP